MTTTKSHSADAHHPDPKQISRAIARRSFCMLATVSPAGRPHVAAAIYEHVAGRLYISTISTSRKARNVADESRVALVIPVRRLPVGAPPSTIQFQATAALLAVDSDEIVALSSDGRLGAITGHGELELPDSCMIRIDLPQRIHTYGLGLSLWELARNPLGGSGEVVLDGLRDDRSEELIRARKL